MARPVDAAARILLAVNEPELAVQIAALISEEPEFELTRQALDVGGVSAALGREDIDVVLLHHKLAPLPVMELARDLTTSFPNVAFVLLVEEARGNCCARPSRPAHATCWRPRSPSTSCARA